VGCIHVPQNKNQWLSLVKVLIKSLIPQKGGKLTCSGVNNTARKFPTVEVLINMLIALWYILGRLLHK
jgi:hypothetical protein